MSTPYTAYWFLFHALWRYCARRGTFKSRSTGSSWLLSMISTGRKNTFCLLLEFWPPSINPELMIEWRLNGTSSMVENWKKLLEITTLSCIEGSIRLHPECLWKARKSTIVLWESVQYWNLLFVPPPVAKYTFHRLSNKRMDCGKWFWRFSFILQKSYAPSSSRCALVARETGHPLSAKSQNLLSAILSHTLWGMFSLIQYHFISKQGQMNDHWPLPILPTKMVFFHICSVISVLRRCNPFYPFPPSFAGFWWIFLMHNTEFEKTWTFARRRLMILSSPINDRYFHEYFSQSFPNLRSHLVLTPIS